MKRLVQLIVLLCSLFIMTVSAFAAESLIDNARLLNAQDKIAVQNALRQVENAYGIRAAVVTVKDSKITDVGKYANNVLDRNYTNGKNGNMVLVVNMANRKWYISSDKRLGKMVGFKQLGTDVASELKGGKYKNAFLTYAKGAANHIEYYKKTGKAKELTKTVARKAPAKKEKNIPVAAGGAVLVGVLGAVFYGNSLKNSMSNVSFATRADQYMKPGSFHLKEQEDNFLYFTYTRVKKARPQDDDRDNDSFDDASDDDHDGAGGSF